MAACQQVAWDAPRIVIAVAAHVSQRCAYLPSNRRIKVNRVILGSCGALLICGLSAGAALRWWMADRCTPPSEEDKARLVSFIQVKYKLAAGAQLGVADSGPVFGSCFRRLVFATLGGKPFRTEVFTSPDFRFLTTDLMDARPDPKQVFEEHRRTAESLVRDNAPVRGMANAPVTVALFSDFQCPYCARMANVLNGLAKSEGDRLKIVYHYFPLSSIHPWAQGAAQAAACAQRQTNTAFWSLHDFMFAQQRQLAVTNFGRRVADWARTTPNLDRDQFQRCISESLTSGQVEQDIALGQELGVRGTPTLFLNGELIDSSSEDELRNLIRHAAAAFMPAYVYKR
jgi:protein-disulfide isomerase